MRQIITANTWNTCTPHSVTNRLYYVGPDSYTHTETDVTWCAVVSNFKENAAIVNPFIVKFAYSTNSQQGAPKRN